MHDVSRPNPREAPSHPENRFGRLGYGTSNLAGRLGRKESIRLLEIAFDAGIRHFDTAPMYGYGAAEGVLGEFLRTKRDKLTLATKFGIEPPGHSPAMTFARNLARVAISVAPSLRGVVARQAESMVSAGNFSVPHATMSLRRSLKALKTSHIDMLLMHEPHVSQITPELIGFLDEAVKRGEIGAYGVAGTSVEMPKILEAGKSFGTVAQFPEPIFDDIASALGKEKICIVHSIFSQRFRAFIEALRQDKSLADQASQALGIDTSDTFRLGRLFLWRTLQETTNGIVLFSSLTPNSIQANATLQRASEFSLSQATVFESLLKTGHKPTSSLKDGGAL